MESNFLYKPYFYKNLINGLFLFCLFNYSYASEITYPKITHEFLESIDSISINDADLSNLNREIDSINLIQIKDNKKEAPKIYVTPGTLFIAPESSITAEIIYIENTNNEEIVEVEVKKEKKSTKETFKEDITKNKDEAKPHFKFLLKKKKGNTDFINDSEHYNICCSSNNEYKYSAVLSFNRFKFDLKNQSNLILQFIDFKTTVYKKNKKVRAPPYCNFS